MLGRKQSLKGDIVLADYGPEETFNESADIEWVNKVNKTIYIYVHKNKKYELHIVLAMGTAFNEDMCTSKSCFCQLQYTENFRKVSFHANDDFLCRHCSYNALYIGNDCQNAYKRNSEGKLKLQVYCDVVIMKNKFYFTITLATVQCIF